MLDRVVELRWIGSSYGLLRSAWKESARQAGPRQSRHKSASTLGSMNKELKEIIRRIERKGYSVVPAGKHQKVKDAKGKTVYTLPTTPSGRSWRLRLIRDLQKRGLL